MTIIIYMFAVIGVIFTTCCIAELVHDLLGDDVQTTLTFGHEREKLQNEINGLKERMEHFEKCYSPSKQIGCEQIIKVHTEWLTKIDTRLKKLETKMKR